MEEAFLPTLRTLFNAPPSSPLAEVNVNNVADLMVQLTNARHLVSQVASQLDVSTDFVYILLLQSCLLISKAHLLYMSASNFHIFHLKTLFPL